MCTDSGLLNYGEHLVPVKCIYPTPSDIGCCPFCGDSSVVVETLFIVVAPVVCGGYVFGPCFIIQYFVFV